MKIPMPRWGRFSLRERKLVAVATAAVALYVGVIHVGLPLRRHFEDTRQEIERKKALLEGYARTVEREGEIKRVLDAIRSSSTARNPLYLKSGKPALAAAEVQSMVKEASATSDISVTSEKILKPVPAASHTTIPVEITVAGDIVRLRDFLHTIETGTPLLRITEMNARVVRRRNYDQADKKYVDVEELQATLIVNGIMKGGG